MNDYMSIHLIWMSVSSVLSMVVALIWHYVGYQKGKQDEFQRWNRAMKRMGFSVTWGERRGLEEVRMEDDSGVVQAHALGDRHE